MNDNQTQKKEIDEIFHQTPASTINIKTELKIPVSINQQQINKNHKEYWSGKSLQLLNDYNNGEAIALYGTRELNNKEFFKHFAIGICAIISNEHHKRGISTEYLKPYYSILESVLILLAKEIDKKELPSQEVFSIIASLQGFLVNYEKGI